MTILFFMAPLPSGGKRAYNKTTKRNTRYKKGRLTKSRAPKRVMKKSNTFGNVFGYLSKDAMRAAKSFAANAALASMSDPAMQAKAAELLKKLQNTSINIKGYNIRRLPINSGPGFVDELVVSNINSSDFASVPGGLGFGKSTRKTVYNVTFGDSRKMPNVDAETKPVTNRVYSSSFVENSTGVPTKAPSSTFISPTIGERRSRLFTYGISLPEIQKRRIVSRSSIGGGSTTGTPTEFDARPTMSTRSQTKRYFPYSLHLRRTFTNLNQYLDSKVTISFVQFDSRFTSTDNPALMSSPLESFFNIYGEVPLLMKRPGSFGNTPILNNILADPAHGIQGDAKAGNKHPRGTIEVGTRSSYSMRNSMTNEVMTQVGSRKTFTLSPGEILEVNTHRYINENITANGLASEYTASVELNDTTYGPYFAPNSIFMLVEVTGSQGEYYKVSGDTLVGAIYPRTRSYFRSTLQSFVAVDETIDMITYNADFGYADDPDKFKSFKSQYVDNLLVVNRSLTAVISPSDIIQEEPAVNVAMTTPKYVIPITSSRVRTSAGQIKLDE